MPDGKNSPGILNMFSHNYMGKNHRNLPLKIRFFFLPVCGLVYYKTSSFHLYVFLFANLIKASDCSLVM